MEYEFEELPITILGKRAMFVDGTAYLEKDGPLFWIRSVVLDTADGTLGINGNTRDPFAFEVFERVRASLYRDRHVAEKWAAHLEDERADAS
jgi:hypothetical protein